MSCESKINLFLDKNDYILKITDDEIINVTGSVGSGKSTYGINYHDNKDYIVIDFDSIGSDNDPKTLTDDIIEGAEVKKPYSSKPGRIIAKVINKVNKIFKR